MKKQFTYILSFIALILSIFYVIYTILMSTNIMDNIGNILSVLILFVFSIIFIIISLKVTEMKKTTYVPLGIFILIIFISFNLLSDMNIIKLQKEEKIENFINKNITEVLKWANANNIEVKQIYEYSDIFLEHHVISQNIKAGTSLGDIKVLEVIISNGPDYEKTIIVPNMLGWQLDEVLAYINENFFINVSIEYEFSDTEKDVVIKQDKNGELKRNEPIEIIFSLGNIEDLQPVALIDLTNKSLLEATVWLKKHGLNYELNYEFNNDIKRNYVIDQSIQVGEILNPNTETGLLLIISKGKEIEVPNLFEMKMDDIIKWVSNNNLKINFSDRYDEKIALGEIIEVNYKPGDIIEEGSLIHIVTSKGQLKIPDFKTIKEYREWANKYNIELKEIYEFSDTIANGNIISLSHEVNSIISNTDKITITVSQGKAVTIPSFSGKTKAQATTLCNSVGLKCSFTYGNYSSTIAKDVVTGQSKRNGAMVVQGTNVILTLSKGKAKVYDFVIQASWLALGSADNTIASLKKELGSRYPGVNFTYVKKDVNNGMAAGNIHPNSPTNVGKTKTVEQGKTYVIWIVK